MKIKPEWLKPRHVYLPDGLYVIYGDPRLALASYSVWLAIPRAEF